MKRAGWIGAAVLGILVAGAAGAWAQQEGKSEPAPRPEAIRKIVAEEMAALRAEIREMVREEVRAQLAESRRLAGGPAAIRLLDPETRVRLFELGDLPFGEERGWLGVRIAEVPPQELRELGLEGTGGVRLTSVVDDSPAEAAGLESGDIVVRIDGKTAGTPEELVEMVSARKPGTKVVLLIRRGGEDRKVQVTLGVRPIETEIEAIEEMPFLEAPEAPVQGAAKPWLGVTIRDLDEESRRELEATRGVVVVEVRRGSPADGPLEIDDVIVTVDGVPVTDVDQLADRIAAGAVGEPLEFEIERGGSKARVVIRLGGRIEAEGDEEAEAFEFGFQVPGEPPRAFLGVTFGEVDPVVAERLGLEPGEGVLVQGVVGGSAAERAGLQAGDVLIAIDGVKLAGTGSLPEIVGSRAAGDTVLVTWGRGGESRKTAVTLGVRPSDAGPARILEVPEAAPEAPRPPEPPEAEPVPRSAPVKAPGYLGIEVSPATPEVRKILGIAEDEGLMVDRVLEGAPAFGLLEAYDVLLRVGGAPVATREALASRLADAGAGAVVRIDLLRRGKSVTVTLALGAR